MKSLNASASPSYNETPPDHMKSLPSDQSPTLRPAPHLPHLAHTCNVHADQLMVIYLTLIIPHLLSHTYYPILSHAPRSSPSPMSSWCFKWPSHGVSSTPSWSGVCMISHTSSGQSAGVKDNECFSNASICAQLVGRSLGCGASLNHCHPLSVSTRPPPAAL